MDKLLFTTTEAAEMLGLSRSYLYEIMATGELPSITLGRARRIPRQALEELVVQRQREQGVYRPGPSPVGRNGTVAAQ